MPKTSDFPRRRAPKKECCDVKVFANAEVLSSSIALENQWEESYDAVQRVNANAAAAGNQSDTDSDAGQETHQKVVKKIAGILKTDTYKVSWRVEDGAAPYEITVEAAGEVVTRQQWSRNDGSVQLARARFYEVADFKARTPGSTRFRVTATDCYGNADTWQGEVREA